MEPLPLWIGRHALTLWLLLLILALLAGDFGWRTAHRRRLAATGKSSRLALRPRTALVLMALFGAVFVLLFWAVWQRTALVGFDAALAQSLHDQLAPNVLTVVAIITSIGKPTLLAVAGAVVAALLALRRNWKMLLPWCVALGGTAVCGEVAKHVMKRVRPYGGHAFLVETSYSFPSGHAMMSMVFFGMLAWLLLRALRPRHQRIAVAVAVGLVTIIGISRVVLQAHYLSDVVAAYALGAFWLVLGIAMGDWMRRRVRIRPLS